MRQHDYYTVAIGTSTRMDGTPSPDKTCGHSHRTTETAEKCQSKLIGYNRKTRECSAMWYNSYIIGAISDGWERIR